MAGRASEAWAKTPVSRYHADNPGMRPKRAPKKKWSVMAGQSMEAFDSWVMGPPAFKRPWETRRMGPFSAGVFG